VDHLLRYVRYALPFPLRRSRRRRPAPALYAHFSFFVTRDARITSSARELTRITARSSIREFARRESEYYVVPRSAGLDKFRTSSSPLLGTRSMARNQVTKTNRSNRARFGANGLACMRNRAWLAFLVQHRKRTPPFPSSPGSDEFTW